MTGTVRWFDAARGHGFTTRDTGEPDCFLHQSGIRSEDYRQIVEGTRLTFDVLEEMGGVSAVNVRILDVRHRAASSSGVEPLS